MEAHEYNASIWEVEAGKSGVQGHSQLSSELKANLGYMRFYIVFSVCSCSVHTWVVPSLNSHTTY